LPPEEALDRILETEHPAALVQSFSEVNDYTHRKGIYINDKLRPFPISKDNIIEMEDAEKILAELKERPNQPDLTNFETYAISRFGRTLYELFMYNYSKKMWGIEPKELTTEYIQNRIELKDTVSNLFEDKFQGVPKNGYTRFFEKMIEDIPLELNTSVFNTSLFDLILYSGRIDELLGYKFGSLQHRSLHFEYSESDAWENDEYGSINLPQHEKYIRKVNFRIYRQRSLEKNWIQYQEPIPFDKTNTPLYPIYTKRNLDLFDKYLTEVCKSDTIIPVGRLGLYKYLEMGQAISLAMNMIPLIEDWKHLKQTNRYNKIKKLLKN